jgi:hypothetical protein
LPKSINPCNLLLNEIYWILFFSGVQRQLTYDMVHHDDPSSVQGLLEYAFKQLQPVNNPKLHLSSRLVNISCYITNNF